MGYAILASLLALGMTRTNPAAEIVEAKGTFESQGRAIAVETFATTTPDRHPAVLILHGAGGLEIGGPEFREFARELARRGYVAQVVHYFDQTGTTRADLATIARSFSSWMLTIGDAIAVVGRRDDVDPGKIGLLGFSLGSYLSLSIASHDARVAAVVEYFGGLPDPFAWNLKRFPPTLILHGEADDVVPVAEARKLERTLRAKGFPHEIRVYPGQGHRFRGDEDRDASERTLRFLDRHLKQSAG